MKCEIEWISVEDRLPENKDDAVLAYWPEHRSWDIVHIQDYFIPITCGLSTNGEQLYTYWYISQGVTHWAEVKLPIQLQ